MKKVDRSEILDWATYDEQRSKLRPTAMAEKSPRRVHLGDNLTFLFENHATVTYQIHEILRAEQIVKEADVRHELATYNELLGDAGELGCTLLIEIEDEAERAVKLRAWQDLPRHIYVRRADGTEVPATFDPRQIGDDRLSSVQYLKFAVGPEAPLALGTRFPGFTESVVLTQDQRRALQCDLDPEG